MGKKRKPKTKLKPVRTSVRNKAKLENLNAKYNRDNSGLSGQVDCDGNEHQVLNSDQSVLTDLNSPVAGANKNISNAKASRKPESAQKTCRDNLSPVNSDSGKHTPKRKRLPVQDEDLVTINAEDNATPSPPVKGVPPDQSKTKVSLTVRNQRALQKLLNITDSESESSESSGTESDSDSTESSSSSSEDDETDSLVNKDLEQFLERNEKVLKMALRIREKRKEETNEEDI